MATFAGLNYSPSLLAFKGNQSVNLGIDRDLADSSLGFNTTGAKAGLVKTVGAPVSHIPQTHNGLLTGSLALNFYNRLWLSDTFIDFGNVVSELQTPVSLWNAYFTPRQLVSITAQDTEGIVLNGQAAPSSLPALAEIIWTLSASISGPPVIDGAFIFQVSGNVPLMLQVIGQRIIAFAFAPNWQRGITESLEWQTEILSSEQGHEQRRALRETPRRSVQADFLIEGTERRRFESALNEWGARTWALPVWTDALYLDADLPAGSDLIPCQPYGFENLALLRQSSTLFEVIEIKQVETNALQLKRPTVNDWPAGTQLLPLRRVMLSKPPAIKRKTDRLWQMEANFLQNEAQRFNSSHNLPLYRGLPVLEVPPEESDDLTLAFERITKLLDNQTAHPVLIDHGKRAFYAVSHGFLAASREERRALLSIFYALNGKQKPLWLPTFADDMSLAEPVGANAFQMDIEPIDYARFFRSRSIRIELTNGTKIYRDIQSATLINETTERLSLSALFGIGFDPSQVKRISWLNLVRQDSDVIRLNHLTDSVMQCKTVFKEVRDGL